MVCGLAAWQSHRKLVRNAGAQASPKPNLQNWNPHLMSKIRMVGRAGEESRFRPQGGSSCTFLLSYSPNALLGYSPHRKLMGLPYNLTFPWVLGHSCLPALDTSAWRTSLFQHSQTHPHGPATWPQSNTLLTQRSGIAISVAPYCPSPNFLMWPTRPYSPFGCPQISGTSPSTIQAHTLHP